MSDLPPAGWYDDPDGGEQQRRWDGRTWTDERRPQPGPPSGTDGEPETPWWRRKWGVILILFVVIMVFSTCGDDEDTPTSPTNQTETEAAGDREDPVAEDTAEPEETPTVAQPESFEDRLAVALGDSNREVDPRFTVEENTADDGGLELVITWAINDNFTENMVKRGAQLDAVNILQAVAESPELEYDQVFLVGTFSMVDQLGNAEEDNVIGATYPRETIEQINFDNFLTENAWNVANQDSLFVHPAFRPAE